MRLVFVASTRYPHLGGQSTHIGDLTRGLEAEGHTVAHVSLADLGDAFVKWFVFRPGYALDKASMGTRLRWTVPIVETLLGQHLRRKAREGGPFDAILAQDPIAWHACRRAMPDVQTTLTVHGYLVQEHLADQTLKQGGGVEAWLWGKEVSAYKGADRLVTVDTRIRDHVVAHGGDAARVTVLKNFVDAARFAPEGPRDTRWPGRKVLVCPRRLVPKNGVRYAALAARELGDPWTVVIAGDGPERAAIEAEKPANCEILGPVAHGDLPPLLRRADAVLVPSVHEKGVEEATSIAALEAMSCGRVTIASAIGGLKELVRHDENGLLVPERDPKAIADAARAMVADPPRATRLGDAARADILANYSLQARVKDYLAVVQAARGSR